MYERNEGIKIIDLRSDTVTTPTSEMREAIFQSTVGDDVYGEDPTINHLEQLTAQILGKENALFMTSGTQANLVAILSQTKLGDEIILDKDSHLFYNETGALASIAGVQPRTLDGKNGQINVDDIKNAIRDDDIHYPSTGLISIENTHARSGGQILPINYMEEVYSVAQYHNIPIHLDGSRLFNAATALEISPKDITKFSDSVQICLSKGLSAPMGSMLAGTDELITKARRWRKALGGGTRQIGIVGAAGIIALNKMTNRLLMDHENARLLAENLVELSDLDINIENIKTNIFIISLEKVEITAIELINQLKKENIFASVVGKDQVRFVTHREITKNDIIKTSEVIKKILKK